MPRFSSGPEISKASANQLAIEAHELAEALAGFSLDIGESTIDGAISAAAATDIALGLSVCRTIMRGLEASLDADTVPF